MAVICILKHKEPYIWLRFRTSSIEIRTFAGGWAFIIAFLPLKWLGIAETHWTEEGKIIQENHTIMIYSGGENHRNEVGIVMKKQCSKINDRILGTFR